MTSEAIITVTKMMESLPAPVQDQVVDHLREYLDDLRDELQWDVSTKQHNRGLRLRPIAPGKRLPRAFLYRWNMTNCEFRDVTIFLDGLRASG